MENNDIFSGKTPYEVLGEPAMLEQLAEEASELSKASLKLARVLRKENPTPVSEGEAREMLNEEASDVFLCLKELGIYEDFNIMFAKRARWYKRLKEMEEENLDEISKNIQTSVIGDQLK